MQAMLAEPPPCSAFFSTTVDDVYWLWGGDSNKLHCFDSQTELWTTKESNRSPHAGEHSGGCTAIGNTIYMFGGYYQSTRNNDLSTLDLKSMEWSKIFPANAPRDSPMNKVGCGLVAVDKDTLCCFGGYGFGNKQPGSQFVKNSRTADGLGHTNECHFFNIKKGEWSSPDFEGDKPPPCSRFSFTKVDECRAVLFGGRQPIPKGRSSDVHMFDFDKMTIKSVKPIKGQAWPAPRSNSGACCLNYGEAYPQLFIAGGVDGNNKTLKDSWVFDVDTGRWTEIRLPETMEGRFEHSLSATRLGPGLTEVLMFGGRQQYGVYTNIAETVLLRFECHPGLKQWTLVDVVDNTTRASPQSLSKKRLNIQQAIAAHSSTASAPSSLVKEQRFRELEEKLKSTERQLEEAVRAKVAAEQKLIQTSRELEGKTKELSAHKTEVWRIPGNKTAFIKKIGSGGWGEVMEGTVRVAMKQLHLAILTQRNLERLQREVKLLAEVRHPNLVQFVGAVLDQTPPLIVTELLDINLRQAYEQSQLGPGHRLSIFTDVARALDYLHQRYEPIIHRDVSAPNVLLERMSGNQWKGKLSDLGSANFLQNAQTMGEGAIVYSAPEVIPQPFALDSEPIPQTVKIDVYSFGIVLCEVTASQFPSQENYREMFKKVQKGHPKLYTLIDSCIKRHPTARPTMADILRYLRKMDPF